MVLPSCQRLFSCGEHAAADALLDKALHKRSGVWADCSGVYFSGVWAHFFARRSSKLGQSVERSQRLLELSQLLFTAGNANFVCHKLAGARFLELCKRIKIGLKLGLCSRPIAGLLCSIVVKADVLLGLVFDGLIFFNLGNVE